MKNNDIKFIFPDRLDVFLAASNKLFIAEGNNIVAEVIRQADPELRVGTSHDNWNGGQYSHTLILHIDLELFSQLGNKVFDYASMIKDKINMVSAEMDNETIENLSIVPETKQIRNWRVKTSEELKVEQSTRMWKDGQVRVFISHLASKKEIASKLKDDLRLFGITSFVAHEDIEPTSEWQKEIETALMTMDCLVALMDEGFHESNWTDQEVGYACARGVKVIPIIRGVNPYGFIGKFQGVKYDSKNMGWRVFRLIDNNSEADAFVEAVKRVKDHNDCVTLAKIFECLSPFDVEHVEEILRFAEGSSLLQNNTTFWNHTKHSFGFHYYVKQWIGRSYKFDWRTWKYVVDSIG